VGREVDRQVIQEGSVYDAGRKYPLQFELTDKSVPHKLRAVDSHTELSFVSGDQRVVFGSKPIDITVPLYDDVRVTSSTTVPLYYIIPPQWNTVIDV